MRDNQCGRDNNLTQNIVDVNEEVVAPTLFKNAFLLFSLRLKLYVKNILLKTTY